MNTAEREPFTQVPEPFTQGLITDVIPEAESASDVVESTQDVDVVTETTAHRKPVTRCVGVNLSEHTSGMIRAISALERRQITVVFTKCLTDFLSRGECEPRPFIPEEERTAPIRCQFRALVSSAIYAQVEERAVEEGRTASMLAQRAILDYIDRSEFKGIAEDLVSEDGEGVE